MSTVTDTMLFIEVATGRYPVYFPMIRTQFQQTISFGGTVPIEDVTGLGFALVADSVVPTGEVVTEGVPTLVDGVWTRTYAVRVFTPDELAGTLAFQQTDLLAQADALQTSSFATGFPYQFADQVYHVQVRAQDKINITAQRTIAKELVTAGQDATFNFRVYENISVPLNAVGMVALGDKTFQQAEAGYQVIWDFKDAVAAAKTVDTLPVLPTAIFTL